ncbi:ParM/StbA family protein [Sporosarcina sp. SAFN-015]|uniref:ParM/StbA family protein n=1 Tax=Sporosarcina sp. SAFN-015 TaxID=3387274 RepID=UPI003F7EA7D4
MSKLILGIDPGNYRGKTAGPYGVDSYRTAICDWFERNIEEDFGEDDMEFAYEGRKGYAGTLASYEDQFGGGAMYGDSKAHDDTLIRVLLAIYRYTQKYCPGYERFDIVVGQPIISHKKSEKTKLELLLRGTHVITVNGRQFTYIIDRVGVAAEGSGAFMAAPREGVFRIIDVGSGTVNCATISDHRHINTASATFNYGVETTGGRANIDAIARAVVRSTTQLKWRQADNVLVCGGIASDLLPLLTEHYTEVTPLIPQLNAHNGMQIHLPTFANAVGFYEIARLTYG